MGTQDGTNFLQKGGLDAVEKAIDAGVVLVMSLWDDHYANMLWLDSTYPTDGAQPGSYRGACSTDSGVPADVEKDQADATVKFSDIKFVPSSVLPMFCPWWGRPGGGTDLRLTLFAVQHLSVAHLFLPLEPPMVF